jgi:hypothetical protein
MDEKKAILKLVSEGSNPETEAIYWTSATFNADKAPYSIRGIKKGKYTAWLFIDANGNASPAFAMPDSGDYWARFDVAVTGDTTRDVDIWSPF